MGRLRLKSVAGLALGVLAGIGGFIDTGGIITATQAGATFHDALVWTVVFGFVGFAVFAEMSARIVVASSQPTYEVIRTSLGPRLAAVPVVANVIVHVLSLAVDVMGMSLAARLLTGMPYGFWVPVLAIALAAALWRFRFTYVDTAAALLGLTMLVVIAAVFRLHPGWSELGLALLHPTVARSYSVPAYLFAVASMLGAFMTPYQFDFYSSGALEEEWSGEDLKQNRVVSVVGTLFGALITVALIAGAHAVLSGNASADTIEAAAEPVRRALGGLGFHLFVVGVFCVSLAASVELCLSGGYSICQYYGLDWGKSGPPASAPAFNLVFVAMILLVVLIDLSGVDPMRFTVITMALASAALPLTFVPLLIIANDPQFMGEHRNTPAVNVVAGIVLLVLIAVTVATVPLLILTHGQF